MKYFLAFDVGTTAMKCILYDTKFNEIVTSNEEYSLLTPSPEIIELPCSTYFDVFCKCVKKIWDAGICPDDVLSVTFTTQGETLMCLDKDGNELSNAIVWIDSRASAEAEDIKKSISHKEFYSVTGIGAMDGALPIAKLKWIRDNQKDVYEKTYKFLLLEDYLIYRLTGEFVSELSLSSSTGWLDIVKGCHYDKILDVCGIDKDKLPKLMPCGKTVSNVSEKAAVVTGLSTKTCVTTGAMDQISSAIGAKNISEGIVTETTGTALVVAATTNKADFSSENMVNIYRHFDDKFIYMPYCSTAGIVLKWFKDEIVDDLVKVAKENGKSAYALIDEEAEKAAPGCDGVICLGHFQGKDDAPDAKGVFYGLSLKTKKQELARSVLEGISCMLNEQISLLRGTGIDIKKIYSLGGGSYSDIWCKIKASMCNVSIVRTNMAQSTALGAAILGSLALGVYDSAEQALEMLDFKEKVTAPDENEVAIYKKVYSQYCKLYKALTPIFKGDE